MSPDDSPRCRLLHSSLEATAHHLPVTLNSVILQLTDLAENGGGFSCVFVARPELGNFAISNLRCE